MSTAPYERHPLGLPPGSVRAILAIVIALMWWTYLVYPPPDVKVPPYLYCLAILVFVFFAAHRNTIAPEGTKHHSPLYLPRGTFRILIVVGTIGVLAWAFYSNQEAVLNRLRPTEKQMEGWPDLTLSLVGGFVLGWLFGNGPWRKTAWYQDVQAWLSIVAVLALMGTVIYDLVIQGKKEHSPDMLIWDCVLVGILSLYYGARS
jgi:hypothetical protein